MTLRHCDFYFLTLNLKLYKKSWQSLLSVDIKKRGQSLLTVDYSSSPFQVLNKGSISHSLVNTMALVSTLGYFLNKVLKSDVKLLLGFMEFNQ